MCELLGGLIMISSVSAVSFRNKSVQDLINTPGKFSNGAQNKAETNFNSRPKRDEEPEGKSWAGYAAAGLALIGVIAGLGYAVKTKRLEHIDVSEVDGRLNKLWTRCKNVAFSIGEFADKNYSKIFKKSEKASK